MRTATTSPGPSALAVRAVVFLLLAGLGFPNPARAGIMTPGGLNPGDQFRIVFVTNTETNATSSDLTTYDLIVSGDAAAAGLDTYQGSPVTWEAIGSTANVMAVDRLPKDAVPLFLPDGTRIADSGLALWSTGYTNADPHLLNADGLDEFADGSGANRLVWTGTAPDGTVSAGGGLGQQMVETGDSDEDTARWVATDSLAADRLSSLYGFSNVLTVPEQAAVIPEPGTLTLMLVGIGGLFGARLARRRRAAAPG